MERTQEQASFNGMKMLHDIQSTRYEQSTDFEDDDIKQKHNEDESIEPKKIGSDFGYDDTLIINSRSLVPRIDNGINAYVKLYNEAIENISLVHVNMILDTEPKMRPYTNGLQSMFEYRTLDDDRLERRKQMNDDFNIMDDNYEVRSRDISLCQFTNMSVFEKFYNNEYMSCSLAELKMTIDELQIILSNFNDIIKHLNNQLEIIRRNHELTKLLIAQTKVVETKINIVEKIKTIIRNDMKQLSDYVFEIALLEHDVNTKIAIGEIFTFENNKYSEFALHLLRAEYGYFIEMPHDNIDPWSNIDPNTGELIPKHIPGVIMFFDDALK